MSHLLETLKIVHDTEFSSVEAARDALNQGEQADLLPASEIEAALPEKGVTLALHRLLARALREEGRDEEADQVLVQIAERLNQEGFWDPMAHVLTPLLDRDAHRVAPLLLRARLQGGPDVVGNDVILRAHEALPKHGVLAWEAAQAYDAAGENQQAVRAALTALPSLLEDKNFDLLEEVILTLLEAEGEHVTQAFVHLMDKLAHHQEWDRFDSFLGVMGDRFTSAEGALLAWPRLRDLWLKHPNPESLRATVVSVLEPTLTAFPSPQAIIRVARINVPSEDPSQCLERLDRACRFPPGHYAEHSGWGLGLIRDNDIESVVIDFPTKPVHRMKMATAERALEPLSPEDLRVWQVTRPDDLVQRAKEDPAALVVMALRRFKDETATVDQLRKVLVPKPITSSGWSSWWKRVKELLVGDSRVDTRRAFENTYRVSQGLEGEEQLELPVWNPRQPALKNIALLETFFEQHSDAKEILVQEYADRVVRVVEHPRESSEAKAAASLWLGRMGVSGDHQPGSFLDLAFDFNLLPKTNQFELLEHTDTTESLCAALGSRLQAVRVQAWAQAGEKGKEEAVRITVLRHVSSCPEAALFLLKDHLGPADSELHSILILKAVIDLIESPDKATHRKRALAFLSAGSMVAGQLSRAPIGEDEMAPITSRLKHWTTSDKYRFPILDFLRETNHEHIHDAVMGHRARAQAKLAERAEGPMDPYDGDMVLTRNTLDRLEAERTRIGMELKTSIPQAIQSARELGDLKENAEYKAAKEKQAAYAARFQELEAQLQHVRLLEDLERPSGVALPGTEVVLEAVDGDAEHVTYWLLGEGDQDLGDHVVSYRASLGQALHGEQIGNEVELPGLHQGRKYRITSVVEKLP